MAESGTSVLPRDLVESQLSMVDLLRAMYPPARSSDDEADSSLDEMVKITREWCETSGDGENTKHLPISLDLTLSVPVEDEPSSDPRFIQMNISVPLRSEETNLTEPPPIIYTLRQPSWLSRSEVSSLGAEMPMDDVVSAFEYVKENAVKYIPKKQPLPEASQTSITRDSEPLLRVWFYFPSLSTREKRKDLVNYAPRYNLTGFVLAGKPGVLCLEGTSANVHNYMNAIKNESWGDIPSYQKKVSERFREECGGDGRKFEGMREITDDLGERRGTRKNRGDMAALEAYLTEQGVGASFSKVIMGS